MLLLDDPDKYSLEEQEAFVNLSKEAKIYKILFEKCIEQFEQDIACAMDIAKKGNVISPKGEIIVKERFLRYIEKLKNELEKK